MEDSLQQEVLIEEHLLNLHEHSANQIQYYDYLEKNPNQIQNDFSSLTNENEVSETMIEQSNLSTCDMNTAINENVIPEYQNYSFEGSSSNSFDDYCQTARKFKYIHHNDETSDILDEKISEESEWSISDICLGALIIRQQYPESIGDEISTVYFALMAKFFPNNKLENFARMTSSYYKTQLLIAVLKQRYVDYPCYIFNKCICGEFTYAGEYRGYENCFKCNTCKPNNPEKYYILPFTPRLRTLLMSKILSKLFDYEQHRSTQSDTISDIFDGSNWQHFKNKMGPNEKLIGLELCWDGTNPFKESSVTKSIWPLFISILNFPSSLRGKLHTGMHLLALDDGSNAIWEPIMMEFQELWNHGIRIDNITYRVAILRVTLDGRGLESLTKTSGN
jgi:hypothetical protein